MRLKNRYLTKISMKLVKEVGLFAYAASLTSLFSVTFRSKLNETQRLKKEQNVVIQIEHGDGKRFKPVFIMIGE
jgi:hypothetical protein